MSVDLATRYLGLSLRSPLIASSSPVTSRLDTLLALEQAGAGAVVLPSLFQEEIEHDELTQVALHEFGSESFPEALSYLPELPEAEAGPRRYLRLVEEARRRLSIPVIASLNGVNMGGWIHHARMLEEAGAEALELNVFTLATDPNLCGAEVEQRTVDLVGAVRGEIAIPLAVKMAPYWTAPANVARRLVDAGADGLVLFNRLMQPDLDLEHLELRPEIVLSTSWESRLPLRWIAILAGRVEASLAATTGAHSAADVLKLLMGGADAVCMASALLRREPSHLEGVLEAMRVWMAENGYTSVAQLKGSMSYRNSPDPAALERANYMKTLTSYSGKVI